MSPPINAGEAADASDDESFVSASATSPTVGKPPLPNRASKPMIASKAAPNHIPKPKPDLAPKPAIARSVAIAPAAGPNSKLATKQTPATTVPMPGLAGSSTVTRTTPPQASSTRPPAVKPKPTIKLAPVSRSHFANNVQDLPTPAQPAKLPPPQPQPQSTSRVIESERYVYSPPQRTVSKRYATPPPGTPSSVVSQRVSSLSSRSPTRTQPIPISGGGGRPPLERPSRRGSSYESALGADIHTPQPSLSGLSLDNLANAMVAGALATSAANSRSHSREIRPPPPPPARRSGNSLLDKLTPGHSRHASRAGSPEKGNGNGNGGRKMKMTLRDNNDSGEEKDGRHGRHRKRNLVKKHPNKHHEGDRKRWRDIVTEKERKRYEGLWASNKGICVGEPVYNPNRWVNPAESQMSLAGSYGSCGESKIGSVQPMGSSLGGPGSFQSTGVGGYQGGPIQAPGLQASPYRNPTPSQSQPYMNPTLSQSQNLSLGVGQGPYPNSLQNLSQQSLATTSGSNSGISLSPQRQPPGRYTISPPPPKDCVSSLVVKDIWNRSRLPPDVLKEVWDLVDRSRKGMLCKDEFCVGLWLIDQRLKGRKLPQRVSDSVWRSLCGLSGVKIREFKGKNKVRHVSGGH